MRFIAKTLFGLEKVLAGELADLGADDIRQANRAVLFSGSMELLYTVNYCSRTALSVLMQISEFRIRSKDDLYRNGLKVDWGRYLGPNDTFSISPVVNSPFFSHTGYPGLILKDAVADYFRKNTGKRPSVDTVDPSLAINLHISNDIVTISLDSSVVPLFKRGYRQTAAVAPLNEALAAGILMLSGWDASASMTDAMCGSGTLPIEAAMMACHIPAGKFRKSYGFEKWKDFDLDLFESVKEYYNNLIINAPVKIRANDISAEAADQTRSNLLNAGLTDAVRVTVSDFSEMSSEGSGGFIFLNPPYGQRIKNTEINELYSMIGTSLKHNFPGNTAWLISSNRESLKKIGLKPAAKYTLFNGPLECLLLKYELYEGSRKSRISDVT
ncbi:MAG TPA: THUMP domain-containing protein [Bacteroidales bacterium]|nr:THUMP domain-containing protein [Bacteroidales bacterium]